MLHNISKEGFEIQPRTAIGSLRLGKIRKQRLYTKRKIYTNSKQSPREKYLLQCYCTRFFE